MRHLGDTLRERFQAAARPQSPRGQSLIIVAAAFIALALFIGLAVDAGILFIGQAQLRRAVDAAAVAAATQMRVGRTPEEIEAFAKQFILMNGVETATVTVSLYNFNNGEQPPRAPDAKTCRDYPADPNYDIHHLCTNPPRKLILVQATTEVQFAFMPLVGFDKLTIPASAQSESASIDAVIVLDTSESMGDDTNAAYKGKDGTGDHICNAASQTDPRNATANCRPLWDAKDAAKAFVDTLYPNYDRVAIVNFDFKAHVQPIYGSSGFSLFRGPPSEHDDTAGTGDGTGIYRALDLVPLHVDGAIPAPFNGTDKNNGWLNPLDSRCYLDKTTLLPSAGCPGTPSDAYALVSTCTGCGIRVASNLLKQSGRTQALWIIIFLSDGGVNVSDVPLATGDPGKGDPVLDARIDASYYPNGFCGPGDITTLPLPGTGDRRLWMAPTCATGGFTLTVPPSSTTTYTKTANLYVRHCGPFNMAGGPTTCPPGSTWVGPAAPPYDGVSYSPPYDAVDYARDMVDGAALLKSTNPNEPINGTSIVIYTIGLGKYVVQSPDYSGEELLRYMAAVGDDGDRSTNPCPQSVPGLNEPAKHGLSCGNYFYAPNGGQLRAIFQDIAKRIFTRLTQ